MTFEGKPCLWDNFSNEYTKREVKERAYAELPEHFDSFSATLKGNNKCVKSAKCGQAKDKKYVSKWMFYEHPFKGSKHIG